MDNIPSLQFGFDGHYVVYLRGTGGETPPVYPTHSCAPVNEGIVNLKIKEQKKLPKINVISNVQERTWLV